MPWAAAAAAVGGALISAKGSKDAAKIASQGSTAKQEMDPRVGSMLFGGGTDKGLLSRYQSMLGTPQNSQLQGYEQAQLNYLSAAPDTNNAIHRAGIGMLGGKNTNGLPPLAYNVGNMVDAPKQNNMDLSGSYKSFINGDRGGNTRLTSAIQGGIDQSKNMFNQMQGAATENLQENILPGIRSNSVLSGQYGGSRQGIAEGNAIGDFAKAQQQTINQFGQNNTNAAVGAQANAYETDSNRALSATQGLGAQQYGVAQQDAATRNAAEFSNVANTNQYHADYAARDLQQQQINQQGTLAGAGLLSGLQSNAYGAGQNQDGYDLSKASQVNGLLSPYLGQVPGSSTSTQPLYSNTAGSALGGAAAGLGLYNQLKQGQTQPYGQSRPTNQNPWPQ